MSEERPSEVLGALPRTRPHRRSDKRASRPATGTPDVEVTPARPKQARPTQARPTRPPRPPRARTEGKPRLRQPAQPAGTPAARQPRKAAPAAGTDILGTAVQAAAELAEIGLSVSARAIRRAVSRLPRP
jgi:hypothetical protein